MATLPHFHITFSPPNEANKHWPKGFWALYQINGDQIADRVVRDEIVKPDDGPAYYRGDVIARHSWCGFIGGYGSLDELTEAVRAIVAKG